MATQPDRIDPQSPPEISPDSPLPEQPFQQPDEVNPVQPDYTQPDRAPNELPPPPD
jgi:hypothetical protein